MRNGYCSFLERLCYYSSFHAARCPCKCLFSSAHGLAGAQVPCLHQISLPARHGSGRVRVTVLTQGYSLASVDPYRRLRGQHPRYPPLNPGALPLDPNDAVLLRFLARMPWYRDSLSPRQHAPFFCTATGRGFEGNGSSLIGGRGRSARDMQGSEPRKCRSGAGQTLCKGAS